MPALTIRVASPADRVLLAGLRDVDLGINRGALRLTSSTRRIQPLLAQHGFHPRPDDERFRYHRQTEAGEFLLDLVLPKGASRHDPPLIEAGLDSVAVPGLAYAIERGADRLDLTLVTDESAHRFALPIAKLDAMLVMKATLVADDIRRQRDRRITDTADAVILAAACAHVPEGLNALRRHRKRSEPQRALRWLRESFVDPTSQAARRVEQHIADEHGQVGGGSWAVATIAGFLAALDASG